MAGRRTTYARLDCWGYLGDQAEGWRKVDNSGLLSSGSHYVNSERPGMKGVCLLDEYPRLFDHTFPMTGLGVGTMDPSQCEVLGMAYKAFDVILYKLAFGRYLT